MRRAGVAFVLFALGVVVAGRVPRGGDRGADVAR